MTRYSALYRLGFTPWERYPAAAASSIASMLDREEEGRPAQLGRALDLGCGRGGYTRELARRGWRAVGLDAVPRAIAAARGAAGPGAEFVVGDVTDLAAADLGRFDFFLDIGCFQGLRPEQRQAMGRGVTELADRGATLLMLAFGPTRLRRLVEGASEQDLLDAFPGWRLLSTDPATTKGLGWPMNRTSPQWYRLRVAR